MQCQKLKTYMETGRVVFLPARSIRPNPAQPRKIFRPEALDELSDSIRQHGILQPLSVRRSGNGYELIAGERRLRAAELAGITDIPCIIMSMDDRESGMAAMVENLQRQDLDFIEEAMGISRLLEDWNMSQEQAARLLGKSQSAVANKLRLLKHSEPVLLALREAGLTERHAHFSAGDGYRHGSGRLFVEHHCPGGAGYCHWYDGRQLQCGAGKLLPVEG